MNNRRSLIAAVAMVATIALNAADASAQPQPPPQPTASAADKARAKEAYDRGLDANAHGDHARAAAEFARADQLAPSPVALQAALDAAVEADDPVLGAELLERSQRAPASGELSASIDAAKKKLGGRAGRVRVGCPDRAACTATLDGAAVVVAKSTWTRTGQHTVIVQVDGEPQTKIIDVRANDTIDVMPTPKSSSTPSPPGTTPPPYDANASSNNPPNGNANANANPDDKKPRPNLLRDGLPPIIFWAGAGATLALGATSVVLAFVTQSLHEDFIDSGCDRAVFSGCRDKKEQGETVQIVTDVGFGATALAGLATIVIGIGFTDWHSGKSATTTRMRTPTIAPIAGGGAVVGYGGRF